MPRRNYRQITTGKTVKGVTTHLSVLSKPAFVFWGYKQGLINFGRLMVELAALTTIDELKKLIKSFQASGLYEKRDKAANAGTLGHFYIENHLQGLPDPSTNGIPEDVIKKAEGCYLTFLDWEKSNIKKVIGSEIELTSEQAPFGGTIDHIIHTFTTPPHAVEILDIKTGKDIYFEAKLQVAAYGKLYEEHYPNIKIGGFHILRLGENGEFTHKYFPSLDEKYYEIFLACVGINENLEFLGEKL